MWNDSEIDLFKRLDTPNAIQEFISTASYDDIDLDTNKSPRYSIQENRFNCFEGGLVTAAVMEYYGYKPLIIDMIAENDDDHIIMVYKHKIFDRWGAIAKSNTTTLRGREPVYNTPRELVMSYFDLYFNVAGDKTLRAYSRPINLEDFNKYEWRTTANNLDDTLSNDLNRSKYRYFDILTKEMIANLSKANPEVLRASLLGSKPDGLYKL